MKKNSGKQKQNYNQTEKTGESFEQCHGDLGKLLYSYSDARTWIDIPQWQKFRKTFCNQRIFLVGFAVLLCVWFITALIYQLCTTVNVGITLLNLLPSFIIIAACTAILLLSAFGGWGEFVRWAFKHRLVHGHDAFERRRLEEMRLELQRADSRKAVENRIDITQDYVVLSIFGKEEIFKRELVTAKIYKRGDELLLVLNIDGAEKEFPVLLSAEEYVPMKKALCDQLTAVRVEVTDKKALRKKIVKEIPSTFMLLLILTAGVMLVVTHYLWVEGIPPFLGVFFIGMSLLAACGTYSFIPAINAVGVPLTFSLVLLVVPPWAMVWFQQNIFHNGRVLQIILKCDVFTAGFSFFTVLGAYAFTFAVSKLIDYVRFGAIK